MLCARATPWPDLATLPVGARLPLALVLDIAHISTTSLTGAARVDAQKGIAGGTFTFRPSPVSGAAAHLRLFVLHERDRMPSIKGRIRVTRLGHRGEFLLALALLDIAQCYRLAWPSPETQASAVTQFLAHFLPLPVWGAIWGAVGVVCLVQAFMQTDRYAFAAASALKVGWAAVHIVAWIGGVSQVWWSVAIWLVFARVVHVIAKVPNQPDQAVRQHMDGAP